MSVLSKLAIAASQIDLPTKRLFHTLLGIDTVTALGTDNTNAAQVSAGKTLILAADGTVGVILPPGEVGMEVKVVNTVASSALPVYPNSGGQINALTVTTQAFSVGAGTEATFYCDVGGPAAHWYVRAAGTLTGVATSATTAQLNVASLAASATRTVTTTASITAADHNGQLLLNSATGFVTTLPAPIAGFQCEVISILANTSGNHTVVTNASANIIKGMQFSAAGDAGDTGVSDDTISFVANSSVAGNRVVLRSDGTSWFAYAFSTLAASMTFTTAS